MSGSEDDNPPSSNMSDLEEAETVLPPPDKYGEEASATTSDEGAEKCIMCELGGEDEEVEVWIECTQCSRWVHESCILPNYPFNSQDSDFLCPDCYRHL